MEEKKFLKNKNELKLACVILKPDGERKFPLIILLHGFTGYKEENHIEQLAKDLENIGIGSVRFDASGYGESEGTLENDYRFTNYIDDVETVYEYVKSLDWVDKTRVGVWGNSMGGIQAVLFASNHPKVKAVILVSAPERMGVSDDLGKLAVLNKWKRDGYTERQSSRFGKIRIPYAFIEDAQKYDASEIVTQVHVPVLVIWGTADVNVSPSQTKKIFDSANEPKEFMEVEGMDHYYKRNPQILAKVNNRILEFLQVYL